MIALSIFLWGLGLMCLIILAVLAMPVDVKLCFKVDSGFKCFVSARFLAGLSRPIKFARGSDKHSRPKRKASKRRRRSAGRATAFLQNIPSLISDLIRTIQIRHLSLNGAFGLGDPADTGQLFGMLAPFIFGVAALPRTEVSLRPDFDRVHLSGEMQACLRIIPIILIPPLCRFGWRVFRPLR